MIGIFSYGTWGFFLSIPSHSTWRKTNVRIKLFLCFYMLSSTICCKILLFSQSCRIQMDMLIHFPLIHENFYWLKCPSKYIQQDSFLTLHSLTLGLASWQSTPVSQLYWRCRLEYVWEKSGRSCANSRPRFRVPLRRCGTMQGRKMLRKQAGCIGG